MPEPTLLADEIVRVRLNRTDPGEDCDKHPGNPWLDCYECHRADFEAQAAEAAQKATERCDERFPRRYLEARTGHPEVLAWIAGMAKPDPRSLLLLGPTGTGKSYQAYAALRSVVSTPIQVFDRDGRRLQHYRTHTWAALTFADLCATLRPRGRDHDPEAVLEKYRKTSVLLIDDLGAAKASEFVEEATYRLINGRYEDMRPAIFTTNLALPELKNAIGDRIASRLAETCTRVVLSGPDRRRTRTP